MSSIGKRFAAVLAAGSALLASACGSGAGMEKQVAAVQAWVDATPQLAGADVKQLVEGVPYDAVRVRGEARVSSAEEFYGLVEEMAELPEEIKAIINANVGGTYLSWDDRVFPGASVLAGFVQPGVEYVGAPKIRVKVGENIAEGYVDHAAALVDEIAASDFGRKSFNFVLEGPDKQFDWSVSGGARGNAGAIRSCSEAVTLLRGMPSGTYTVHRAKFWEGQLKEISLWGSGLDEAVLMDVKEYLERSGMIDGQSGTAVTVFDPDTKETGSAVIGGTSQREPKTEWDTHLRQLLGP